MGPPKAATEILKFWIWVKAPEVSFQFSNLVFQLAAAVLTSKHPKATDMQMEGACSVCNSCPRHLLVKSKMREVGRALLKSCSMESLSIWYLRWFCRSWNLAPMWKFAKYSIRPNFAENVRESVDCVTIVSRLCYDCVDVVAVISVYRKPTGLTAPWTFVTRTARAPTCHWHRRRWSGHGHSTRASKATEKADVQSIDDFDTIWKLMSPEAKKFTPLSQVMSVMSSM